MKTVRDLSMAIQSLAEQPDKADYYLKEIDACLRDGVDPFELYHVSGQDHYISSFEIALVAANTIVIDKLLKSYKSNLELLFEKLSGNTDNFEDTSINNKDGSTVREEMNFLQLAAIASNEKVLKLICNMFGDDNYLRQSKKLAPLINQPIRVMGKRVAVYGLAEYKTFSYFPTSIGNASNNSLDLDFYSKHPEQREAAIDYMKKRRFYRAQGIEAPVLPAEPLRLVLSNRAIFVYLMGIDSINMEATTAADSAPYFELLEGIAACLKDPQIWSKGAKKIHIGSATITGFIEDGVAYVKAEGFVNHYGYLPISCIFNCSDFVDQSKLVSAYVANKQLERTRRRDSSIDKLKTKQEELEVKHEKLETEVVDIRSSIEKDAKRVNLRALAEIAAYTGKQGSTHSDSSTSASSGKKGSPKQDSPQHGHEELLKEARKLFFIRVRDHIERELLEAQSPKGAKKFFDTKARNLALFATSAVCTYLVPYGAGGIVAAPFLLASDQLQEVLGKKKAEDLACQVDIAADGDIEAAKMMAIIITLRLTLLLADKIHLAEATDKFDELKKLTITEVTKAIKALANADLKKGNPIKFVQDEVVAEVQDKFKPGKPKLTCVIS